MARGDKGYSRAKARTDRAVEKREQEQAALTKKGEQAGHGVKLTRKEVKAVKNQLPGDR